MTDFLEALFNYLKTASDNEYVMFSLILVCIMLLFNNWKISNAYKDRLKDKDEHIEDLVKQRNMFQEKLLNLIDIKRESTSSDKPQEEK